MTKDKEQIKTAIKHYDQIYLALIAERRETLLKKARLEHEMKETLLILLKLRTRLEKK